MKMKIHQFDLRLRHTFTIARGSVDVQPTMIVELEEDGIRGFGEATTNPYFGATFENMTAALDKVRADVESHRLEDPAEFWETLDSRLCKNRFAQCALDQAAYDLWGKKLGQPVYKLWGLAADNLPPSNYTIGIDKIDVMVEKMNEFSGWPIYKIKLGTVGDLEIVRQLRQHTDAIFRVDANCGWKSQETIDNSRELAKLGVEFIEQPLPPEGSKEMPSVAEHSVLPIMADESCQVESDVEICSRSRFDGINIKLVKCGGLTPARRMIERARQLDMKVMVGCMTESSIGISAIAQLLPMLDYVDMDGAVLLAEDIAAGVELRKGVCRFADENGCGARLL